MMLDSGKLGADMAVIVRDFVARSMAPVRKDYDELALRCAALEKRLSKLEAERTNHGQR